MSKPVFIKCKDKELENLINEEEILEEYFLFKLNVGTINKISNTFIFSLYFNCASTKELVELKNNLQLLGNISRKEKHIYINTAICMLSQYLIKGEYQGTL